MIRIRYLLLLLGSVISAQAAAELTNPGFETGDFTGWVAWAPEGGSHQLVSTNPASGNFHTRLVLASGNGFRQGGLYQDVPSITAGETVQVSIRALNPSSDPLTNDAQLVLRIEFLDQDSNLFAASQSLTVLDAESLRDGYAEASVSSPAPPGTLTARFVALLESSTGEGRGSVYLDDASLNAAQLQLSLEEPFFGNSYSGISNLRGWAVGENGIDRVEWWLDGIYKGDIPFGGARNDVGREFPGFPGSNNAGFSAALNYSLLSAGEHSVLVQATDSQGIATLAGANFVVTRFHRSYFPASTNISTDTATFSKDGGSGFRMSGVVVDGKRYDLRFDWDTQRQGWSPIQIDPQ